MWDDTVNGGMWKSGDGGVTWRPNERIRVVPIHGHIVSLVFSPAFAADRTLFASSPPHYHDGSTYGGGVYRSVDGGVTWGDELTNGCMGVVQKLVVAPNSGAGYSIYGTGNTTVYHSNDSGASWNCPALDPHATGLLDIALSPSFAGDGTIVLATGQGVVRSTDRGATWASLGWTGAPVQRVCLSPAYPQDRTLGVALEEGMFGATYPGGTFLSRDNGASWEPAGIVRPALDTLTVAPDFAHDQKLWAAAGTGTWKAYRSPDGGQTWLTQHYQNFGGSFGGFNGIAAMPGGAGPYELYAVTKLGGPLAGVYKSVDDGASFNRLDNSPQYGNAVVAAAAANGQKSVWVGNTQGVHRSLSGGVSWTERNGNLPAGEAVSLAVAPGASEADRSHVFAVLTGAQAGLYRSTDGGGQWTKVPLPSDAEARHVSLSPDYLIDRTVWVSTAANGVVRSSTGGDAWQKPDTIVAGCGPVQATGEGAARVLWAACGSRLYASADGGLQWAVAGPAGLSAAAVATSPTAKTVFVGTNDGSGIWRGQPDAAQVKVVDEGGAPVAGAEVYRNGAPVGVTGADGLVETRLSVNDKLIARKLVKVVPSNRAYHNPGGGANWAYRIYVTSLAIPAIGEPIPFSVSNPLQMQTLTVRKDNALIGFNLVVSVEWDASADYLQDLRQGLLLASREMYDASNGQMLFERMTIYDNGVAMADADLRVQADNQSWPRALIRGLFRSTERPDAAIFTGPYYDGHQASQGSWAAGPAAGMVVHEFGHYGLHLYDSYLFFTTYSPPRAASCTGPEIKTNQSAATNATLMYDHVHATEFSMFGVGGAWSPACEVTAQYEFNRASDWATIAGAYSSAEGLWRLKTPRDYGQVVAGPHAIPVARWTRAEVGANAETGACALRPTIQALGQDGRPLAETSVYLERGGRLIYQGLTDHQGLITLLGAVGGDHVVYEVLLPQLGAADVAPAFTFGPRLTVRRPVACPTPESQAASATADTGQERTPVPVTLELAPFDVQIRIAPGEAVVRVTASVPLAAAPTLTWTQLGATDSASPGLRYDAAAQAYVGSLPFAPELPQQGVLMATALDGQGRTVRSAAAVGWVTATPDEPQQIASADGRALAFVPGGVLQGQGQLTWQPRWPEAPPPAGLKMLAGPYALKVSPTLTPVDPTLRGAGLTLYYLDGDAVDADSLQIATWDEQRWAPLDTTVLTVRPAASAAIHVTDGVYALFGRRQSQVYLPVLQKR